MEESREWPGWSCKSDPATLPLPGFGDRREAFLHALPWLYGIAQVLGSPAAPPRLCHRCIPAVWRLAGNRIISKPSPSPGTSSAPHQNLPARPHSHNLCPFQSLPIPRTCPSTWSAERGQGDTRPPRAGSSQTPQESTFQVQLMPSTAVPVLGWVQGYVCRDKCECNLMTQVACFQMSGKVHPTHVKRVKI